MVFVIVIVKMARYDLLCRFNLFVIRDICWRVVAGQAAGVRNGDGWALFFWMIIYNKVSQKNLTKN